MSNAKDYENALIAIINDKLPNYTTFTEWEENGFEAEKGAQINVDYSTTAKTSEQESKIQFEAIIYLYIEYCEDGDGNAQGLAVKEQLRADFETLAAHNDLNFADGQKLMVISDFNRQNKCKAISFELILN